MTRRVLVTGGAGFIGSFLVDALIGKGDAVRILDNLEGQVHQGKKPSYLHTEAEFIQGDVRDRDTLRKAVTDMDAVVHCAAAVGVAQSQYEIQRYTTVNAVGMANLLDVLVNEKHRVTHVLLPASMTAYGEGNYECKAHGTVRPGLRSVKQLEKKEWELRCPACSATVHPIPTPETSLLFPASVYAITKNMQEELLLSVGRTYGFRVTAFRLFNVYGPRQSLSNPYTGVTAIFLSRLRNHEPPVIYEDGLQTRDFVSVHDVVRAFLLALENKQAHGKVFNIGSGTPVTIRAIAETAGALAGIAIPAKITGEFRKNDIRHCFADTQLALDVLDWKPEVSFAEGMGELVAWSAHERAVDRFEEAASILASKKLRG